MPGTKWSEAEDTLLLEADGRGARLGEIAKQLGRTPRSVQARRNRLDDQAIEDSRAPVKITCWGCGRVIEAAFPGGGIEDNGQIDEGDEDRGAGAIWWECKSCGERMHTRILLLEGQTRITSRTDPDAGLYMKLGRV